MHMPKPVVIAKILFVTSALIGAAASWALTPVDIHGALAVQGNKIVDKTGKPAALSGPSFFWSNTGMLAEKFFVPSMVAYYKNEWNASIVRAALGVDLSGGYLEQPEINKQRIFTLIDAASAAGLYVIVDWHSHHAEDHPKEAVAFFEEVAKKYGKQTNIIYEVYNEPLRGVSWSKTIKPYAETVIAAIRAIDPTNLIIVGTPSWSQDVDDAAKDPIKNVKNIAYTLHFYAGSHSQHLRDKALAALNKGLPLMVTEWGTVNANGDGGVDEAETKKWFVFMKQHHLTNCNWAVSDKAETASHFKFNTQPAEHIEDSQLTASGIFVKSLVQNWENPDKPKAH